MLKNAFAVTPGPCLTRGVSSASQNTIIDGEKACCPSPRTPPHYPPLFSIFGLLASVSPPLPTPISGYAYVMCR